MNGIHLIMHHHYIILIYILYMVQIRRKNGYIQPSSNTCTTLPTEHHSDIIVRYIPYSTP